MCSIQSILLLLGNDLSSFGFLLKMTDMSGIIRIAQILTCVVSSINSMLSVLFATESCYTVKENNNNKENSLCQRKLPFYWRKLREEYFVMSHFLPVQITIFPTQIEKSLFCVGIILPRQKNLNCKNCFSAVSFHRRRSFLECFSNSFHRVLATDQFFT